jgi:REP element-mobilizing transposase RayT
MQGDGNDGVRQYDPEVHHRRSVRLKGYDYSATGAYFVTICVHNRACLLGQIADGKMILNDAGNMIARIWNEIPQYYPGIQIDAFQAMPNHVHGIVWIVGAGPSACPGDRQGSSLDKRVQEQEYKETGIQEDILGSHEGLRWRARGDEGQPRGAAPTRMSLGDVVLRFKTLTTKHYIDGVKQNRWAAFDGKLWQRNYYEHIIHGDRPLRKIRKYITDNPMAWQMDQLHPQYCGVRMDEMAVIEKSIIDMEDD